MTKMVVPKSLTPTKHHRDGSNLTTTNGAKYCCQIIFEKQKV